MSPEIRRAEEAERLMNEPLLKEAFETIESAIVERMKRCDVGDSKQHQDLIVTLQLLGKVKQHIKTVIDTGKMARIEEERKSWADRFKRKA